MGAGAGGGANELLVVGVAPDVGGGLNESTSISEQLLVRLLHALRQLRHEAGKLVGYPALGEIG